MAFNGSGTYIRNHDWTDDRDAAIKITASRFDAENDGFATALSMCITKDGQQTITAAIPFNDNLVTGLTDPVNPQDGATKNYVDTNFIGAGGGTTTGPIVINSGANPDVSIDEDGVNRAATPNVTWNIQNSGAGTMQLLVDNVAVPTISSVSTLTNKTLTAPVMSGVLVTDFIAHSGDDNNRITFGADTQTFETAGVSRMNISDLGLQIGTGARVTTILDEDDMTSDSATALATQQSIKKYVDDNAGSFGSELLHVRDEKTSGTGGGTFSSGAQRVRDLNTVVTNEISGASLASDTVTLPIGTYYAVLYSTVRGVDSSSTQLYNSSDSAIAVLGGNAHDENFNPSGSSIHLAGRFTIAATKNFQVRSRCQTSRSSTGFGDGAGYQTEVFTDLRIWKVG